MKTSTVVIHALAVHALLPQEILGSVLQRHSFLDTNSLFSFLAHNQKAAGKHRTAGSIVT